MGTNHFKFYCEIMYSVNIRPLVIHVLKLTNITFFAVFCRCTCCWYYRILPPVFSCQELLQASLDSCYLDEDIIIMAGDERRQQWTRLPNRMSTTTAFVQHFLLFIVMEKVYFRSQILERPSISQYWNICCTATSIIQFWFTLCFNTG